MTSIKLRPELLAYSIFICCSCWFSVVCLLIFYVAIIWRCLLFFACFKLFCLVVGSRSHRFWCCCLLNFYAVTFLIVFVVVDVCRCCCFCCCFRCCYHCLMFFCFLLYLFQGNSSFTGQQANNRGDSRSKFGREIPGRRDAYNGLLGEGMSAIGSRVQADNGRGCSNPLYHRAGEIQKIKPLCKVFPGKKKKKGFFLFF